MKKTFADFLAWVQDHNLEDTTVPNCESIELSDRTSNYFNYIPTDEDDSDIEYQLHCWKKDSGEEYIDVRLYVYDPDRAEDVNKVFMMVIEFNITNRTFSLAIKEYGSNETEFQAINMPTTTQIQSFIPNKPSNLWDEVLKEWINERCVCINFGEKFFNGTRETINIINHDKVIRKTINKKRILCASEDDIMISIPPDKSMRINWDIVKCGDEFGIPVNELRIPANWKTKKFEEGEYDIIILPWHYISKISCIRNPDLVAMYRLPDNVRGTDEVVYDETGQNIIGVKGLLKAWI